MTHCQIFVALFCLLRLAIIVPTNANNKLDDYLNAHNSAREAAVVGSLTWVNDLAAYAKSHADRRIGDCNSVRSRSEQYGENIIWSSGELSGAVAVNKWVEEKGYYNYDSNICTDGDKCLDYTQVVWRKSVRVGCARVSCNNGGTLVLCNYDPPGNNFGQKPY